MPHATVLILLRDTDGSIQLRPFATWGGAAGHTRHARCRGGHGASRVRIRRCRGCWVRGARRLVPGAWCLASDGITAIEAFVRSLRPDERAHRKPQGLSPSGAAGLPWRGPDVPVPFRCCLRVQERAVRHMAPGQPQSSWRVPRSVVPVGNSTTTSPTRCAPLRPVVFALPTPHREGVNVLLGGGTARQARSSSPGRSRLSDG